MYDEIESKVTESSGSDIEAFQFESEILAGYEFWQTCRSKRARQPELDLMAAVLDDALACYFKNLECRTRKQRTIFQETRDWFSSSDDNGVFSFISICSHLAIDADYVRRSLVLDKRAHHAEVKRDKTLDSKKRLAA